MVNAIDKVNIKCDFHIYSELPCRSNYSDDNSFTKGIMKIYGNIFQHSGNGLDDGEANNFVPSDSFKLVFYWR